MINYFLKKGVILCFSLFAVITLTFIIMHSVSGDPFANEQTMPEEVLKALRSHYGLDQPLISQYLKYVQEILNFDFGSSLKYPGRDVLEIIREGFPASFILGLEAFLLSLVGGILIGTLASQYSGQWQDRVILFISVLGISLPSFLIATFLQYFLSVKWDLLPTARWGTFSHTLIPVLTLSVFPMAFIARLLRTNMGEVLKQDYVMFAKSKGLGPVRIFFRHVFKPSFVPVIAYLGPLLATILLGSFVVEKIFGIPGLGQWVVTSIFNRDYPVIMGITVFYSLILFPFVFLTDVICCMLDPRIRNITEKK